MSNKTELHPTRIGNERRAKLAANHARWGGRDVSCGHRVTDGTSSTTTTLNWENLVALKTLEQDFVVKVNCILETVGKG